MGFLSSNYWSHCKKRHTNLHTRLSIKDQFREKLSEFSIKNSFEPILPKDLKQLAKIDDSIVIVSRASDRAECLVQKSLVTMNGGGKFKQRGFLWRRET